MNYPKCSWCKSDRHKPWCFRYKGKKKICGCPKNKNCSHSQSSRDYGGVGM